MKSSIEETPNKVNTELPALYIFDSGRPSDKGLIVLFSEPTAGTVVKPDNANTRKIGQYMVGLKDYTEKCWTKFNGRVVLEN